MKLKEKLTKAVKGKKATNKSAEYPMTPCECVESPIKYEYEIKGLLKPELYNEEVKAYIFILGDKITISKDANYTFITDSYWVVDNCISLGNRSPFYEIEIKGKLAE